MTIKLLILTMILTASCSRLSTPQSDIVLIYQLGWMQGNLHGQLEFGGFENPAEWREHWKSDSVDFVHNMGYIK